MMNYVSAMSGASRENSMLNVSALHSSPPRSSSKIPSNAPPLSAAHGGGGRRGLSVDSYSAGIHALSREGKNRKPWWEKTTAAGANTTGSPVEPSGARKRYATPFARQNDRDHDKTSAENNHDHSSSARRNLTPFARPLDERSRTMLEAEKRADKIFESNP